MFYVYVIQSLNSGIRYTGQTENLTQRIRQHDNGSLGKYTKGKGPWVLIYFEMCITRSEALKREKYLKSGAGRDFIKRHIASDTDHI
jgi:putative endonuclease